MKKNGLFRFLSAVLMLIQLSLLLPAGVFADETDGEETLPVSASRPPEIVMAKSALVYNFENDTVLFEYNTAERVYPTSTVKLMTAIVAYEALADRLDMPITVTKEMKDQIVGNEAEFELDEDDEDEFDIRTIKEDEEF